MNLARVSLNKAVWQSIHEYGTWNKDAKVSVGVNGESINNVCDDMTSIVVESDLNRDFESLVAQAVPCLHSTVGI